MYEIITYKNKDGEDKITEYITELSRKAQTSKIHRVKIKKIIQYLDLLRTHGTMAGLPVVKHIEDKLWELRPTDDRYFSFIGKTTLLYYYTTLKSKLKKPLNEK